MRDIKGHMISLNSALCRLSFAKKKLKLSLRESSYTTSQRSFIFVFIVLLCSVRYECTQICSSLIWSFHSSQSVQQYRSGLNRLATFTFSFPLKKIYVPRLSVWLQCQLKHKTVLLTRNTRNLTNTANVSMFLWASTINNNYKYKNTHKYWTKCSLLNKIPEKMQTEIA